uniref:Transposase, IS116/IS110/IS902 n=1 Tax=Magnetococcus massalia (strain MO-1) TaxID=451514 RepID=A0A1S7LHY5_MAGMO|nr:Transposase, IS116/IS110/IS902 [Candidatus Magnetococcus massalia]
MGHRTALINQIRGLLHEYGLIIPKGAEHVRRFLGALEPNSDHGLTARMVDTFQNLREELEHLDSRLAKYDSEILSISQEHQACRRLKTHPGIGPLIATAVVAAVGDVKVFRNGREMAAWLGLVPRQHSTGGKPRLLGISKRGDVYIRTLLIHGARSVLRRAHLKDDCRSRWLVKLGQRRGTNIAAVALANRTVRSIWAMLSKDEDYRVEVVS